MSGCGSSSFQEKTHTKALQWRARERTGQVLRTTAATFRANIQLYELFSGNSIFMKLNEGRNNPVKSYHHLHNYKFMGQR